MSQIVSVTYDGLTSIPGECDCFEFTRGLAPVYATWFDRFGWVGSGAETFHPYLYYGVEPDGVEPPVDIDGLTILPDGYVHGPFDRASVVYTLDGTEGTTTLEGDGFTLLNSLGLPETGLWPENTSPSLGSHTLPLPEFTVEAIHVYKSDAGVLVD